MSNHSESDFASLNTDAILLELQNGPFSKELIKGYQLDLQCTLQLEDLVSQEKFLQGDLNEDVPEPVEGLEFYNKVRNVIRELMGVKNHYHTVLAQALCKIQEQERKLGFHSVLIELHNHINEQKDEEINRLKETIRTMTALPLTKESSNAAENFNSNNQNNICTVKDLTVNNGQDVPSEILFTIQSITSPLKTVDILKADVKEFADKSVQTIILSSNSNDLQQLRENLNQNSVKIKNVNDSKNTLQTQLTLTDEALSNKQKPPKQPTPKRNFTPVLKSITPQPASNILHKLATPRENRPPSTRNSNKETPSQRRKGHDMDKPIQNKAIKASHSRRNSNTPAFPTGEISQHHTNNSHSLKKSPSLPSFSQKKNDKPMKTEENIPKTQNSYRERICHEPKQDDYLATLMSRLPLDSREIPKGIRIKTDRDDRERIMISRFETNEETWNNNMNSSRLTSQNNVDVPYKIDLGRGVSVTVQMSPRMPKSQQSTPTYTPRDSISQAQQEMALRNSKDFTDVLALQKGLKKLAKGKTDKPHANGFQITQDDQAYTHRGTDYNFATETEQYMRPKLSRSQSATNTKITQPFDQVHNYDNEKIVTNINEKPNHEETVKSPLRFNSEQDFKDSFSQEKPSYMFSNRKIESIKKNLSPQSSITNSLFQDINSISFNNNNDMIIREPDCAQTNKQVEPQGKRQHFELFALKDMNRAFNFRDNDLAKVSSPCFGDKALTERGMRLCDENSSGAQSRRSSVKRENIEGENIGKVYGNKNLVKVKKWAPLLAKK